MEGVVQWGLMKFLLWESEELIAEDMTSELRWTLKQKCDFAKLSRRAEKWLIEEMFLPKHRETAQTQKYMFREVCMAQ